MATGKRKTLGGCDIEERESGKGKGGFRNEREWWTKGKKLHNLHSPPTAQYNPTIQHVLSYTHSYRNSHTPISIYIYTHIYTHIYISAVKNNAL